MYMPPRPLNPAPVYPSSTVTSSSYTVRWKSVVDVDRAPYPMTYDILSRAFGNPLPFRGEGSNAPDERSRE